MQDNELCSGVNRFKVNLQCLSLSSFFLSLFPTQDFEESSSESSGISVASSENLQRSGVIDGKNTNV
jgi:hypothetical protein